MGGLTCPPHLRPTTRFERHVRVLCRSCEVDGVGWDMLGVLFGSYVIPRLTLSMHCTVQCILVQQNLEFDKYKYSRGCNVYVHAITKLSEDL